MTETGNGDDGFDCPRCGAQMEKRTEDKPIGGFGSSGPVAHSSSAYLVCPECGHDTRRPNVA